MRNKSEIFKLAFLHAAAGFTLAMSGGVAFGQTPPEGSNTGPVVTDQDWQWASGTITTGGPYKTSDKNRFGAEYLFADRTDGPGGVAFMCAGRGLIALVSLEGREKTHRLIAATITADKNKQSNLRAKLAINGEVDGKFRGMFSSVTQAIVPIDGVYAKKFYNAAILQQDVRLSNLKGLEEFTLNLPAPNQDFAQFGIDCGLGKTAKPAPEASSANE